MKVIVGMSGGVDSSVSALLLQRAGYQVEAVFMKNWDDDSSCQANEDYHIAQQVCSRLKIKLHHVNFSEEYKKEVFNQVLDQFQAGLTPNPDILCNKKIKFNYFYNFAKSLGTDFIATGHYAQISQNGTTYKLLKGKDQNKDQSYFLYAINQEILPYILFPIGHLQKSNVREIAKEAQLPNYDKKDSTGICFIGEQPFKPFLNTYLLKQPGKIKDVEGNILGEHDGLMFYTYGQRSGLEIGGKKGYSQKPWYVIDKILSTNTLIVGQDNNHPLLFSKALICDEINLLSGILKENILYKAKMRYRQSDQSCQIIIIENGYQVIFETLQRAVTPGQSVVFYQDEVCLGGGVIKNVIRN